MRRLILLAVGLVLAAGGVAKASPAGAVEATNESDIPTWVWTKTWDHCEYEDSNNCIWNAKRDGLGGGTSYIATSKKRIIYIEHYEAYRLTHDAIRRVYAP